MISGGANHTELRYPEDTWQYISACRTCHILLFQYCQCSKLKFLILLSCSRTLIGKDEHGRVFIPAVTKKPETKPPLTNKSMASRHNLLCPKRIPEPFIINTQRIYLSKLFLYLEPTFSAEFQYFFHFRFNNVNIWINLPSCQCSPNLYFQSGFHCCALFIYLFFCTSYCQLDMVITMTPRHLKLINLKVNVLSSPSINSP